MPGRSSGGVHYPGTRCDLCPELSLHPTLAADGHRDGHCTFLAGVGCSSLARCPPAVIYGALTSALLLPSTTTNNGAGSTGELWWLVLVVAEPWHLPMPSAGSRAVSFQLKPGLVQALGQGRHLCSPHWHPLGHQCGLHPLCPSPRWGRAPRAREVRPLMALPCLLWAGHRALLSGLGSTTLPVPTSTPPSKPEGLVCARTAELRPCWGNWWQQTGLGTALLPHQAPSSLDQPAQPVQRHPRPSPCKTTPLLGLAELKIEPCLWKVHVG